jgi:hypothetical protein
MGGGLLCSYETCIALASALCVVLSSLIFRVAIARIHQRYIATSVDVMSMDIQFNNPPTFMAFLAAVYFHPQDNHSLRRNRPPLPSSRR